MSQTPPLTEILDCKPNPFDALALSIFQYQAQNCKPYQTFLHYLGCDPRAVTRLSEIPFLPIESFKYHDVYDQKAREDVIFGSSGTTGVDRSFHKMASLSDYHTTCVRGFESVYGDLGGWHLLPVLPSYNERSDSSLIAMVDHFFSLSANSEPVYYLGDDSVLRKANALAQAGRKVLMIGVTYALLDLAEDSKIDLDSNVVVMETGGMKGRRREMTRQEVHALLTKRWGITNIHSEYGMTELSSQAYSRGNGLFFCPPWMQMRIRDINDPLSLAAEGKTGGINVIDLANVHSCSFLATQDLGRKRGTDGFEILGRFDHSDVRGCNLMVAE